MTMTVAELTAEQALAAEAIDALDLEPVVYKLMHAEPGEDAMTLAEADQLIAAYRCFLKLCAWYPGESVVPTRAIDRAWHTHLLDTAKYAADSHAVFGYFLHHFPYFGMRGADDQAALSAAFERTMDLFRAHFGVTPGGAGSDCSDGSLCVPEGTECDKRAADLHARQPCSNACQVGKCSGTQCNGGSCHRAIALDEVRPRPDRSVVTP